MSVSFERAEQLVQHHSRALDRDHTLVCVLAQVSLDKPTEEPVWAAAASGSPSNVEAVGSVHDAHVEDGDVVTDHPLCWSRLGSG